MPDIERGSSTSEAPGYNAMRPPELPSRPVGGFRNRSARAQSAAHHERLWGRPVGEDALRLAGARQKTALSARAFSVAASRSERFLPGRHREPGEHTYQSLQATASPEHAYEPLDVRTHTPPAEGHPGIGPSESVDEEPHYEFAPPETPAEEPHYEFGPLEPAAEEPDYDLPPSESPFEESYGESAVGETGGEDPHYEFAPREPDAGEHVYDTIAKAGDYESPVPSGLGSLNGLGVYLVNGLEGGTIPDELKDDLQTALVYAKQVDQDIGRAVTLLDKLNAPRGTLTGSERQELNSLVASNKHNLARVQHWLMRREEQLGRNGSLTPETRSFFQALQTRIADRHMDLADLTCLYDLDEASPDEPVSREDRCNAHLLHAQAAVAVARALPDADPAVKDRLVADLEQHRDLLIELKNAAGDRLEVPDDGRLALAGKELWETPVPLQKSGAGSGRDVAALRARWRDTGTGQATPLPVAHPKVGQARMLQEFIKFRLGESTAATGETPNLKRLFRTARNEVINGQAWESVTTRVHTSMPDAPDRSVTVESQIVPGKAFATRFAEDYPSNGVNCSDRTQYKHVPNLAQTTLTNSSGEVLFSGFRHGVLDAYDIDAEYLASLPDAGLRTMIADLLTHEAPADGSREAFVEERLALIRSDPKAAQRAAETMRGQASAVMASELAVAALVADPDKLEEALDGETVGRGAVVRFRTDAGTRCGISPAVPGTTKRRC